MHRFGSQSKTKCFDPFVRPSQSLHSRGMNHPKLMPQLISENLTVCIIFKKKKIPFSVQNNLPFKQLLEKMYKNLQKHVNSIYHDNPQKAIKIIKNIVGFQSADGDINFDYRLSLEKGNINKTKFFYPFAAKTSSSIKYKIYNCLAIGGFSKVYLARSYENGQFYAIKFIKKDPIRADQERYDSLFNQIEIAKQTDHPFLVKLMQAFETKHFFCLVFEYCPGGELFYLLKRVKIMPQQMAKFYFMQILYGIQYLHSKSILYRDLKPQNILIDADGNCKIVDFGLSKKVDSRGKTFSYCGSAQYMAPQMILRTGHSYSIDYYSIGALLYELVTGLPPYYSRDHQELQENIVCVELSFPYHVELSSQIKDLLQKLLNKDQKQRLGSYIGIKQILFHPWVGKFKSADILQKTAKVPFSPNLLQYNFDTSELGNDEEQFTALVYNDVQNQSEFYKEYHKNSVLCNFQNPYIEKIPLESKGQNSFKQNIQTKISPFSKLKGEKSKQKLRAIIKIHRNRNNHNSNQKSVRTHITDERHFNQIMKLSPYLNLNGLSPSKGLKMTAIDRSGKAKLRKICVQRNKVDTECPQ